MAKAEIQYVQYYTAGSAAPELVPSYRPEKEQTKRTKTERRSVLYIDPVAILGTITAVILLICLLVAVGNYKAAQNENMQLRSANVALEQRTLELQRQYRAGYDLEAIRMEAVLMGYVPSSELEHITMEPAKAAPVPEVPGKWEQFWMDLAELFA